MSQQQCESANFKQSIKLGINGKSPVGGSDLICCAKDGCNWNDTTADKNMSYQDILASHNASTTSSTLSAGSDLGYVILCLVIILVIVVCCIWCCFVFVCAKKDKQENRSNRLSPDIEEDIPVTPIRNITHVHQSRDHERYSAIDKKIYKR